MFIMPYNCKMCVKQERSILKFFSIKTSEEWAVPNYKPDRSIMTKLVWKCKYLKCKGNNKANPALNASI
jgi:hypothetical protein